MLTSDWINNRLLLTSGSYNWPVKLRSDYESVILHKNIILKFSTILAETENIVKTSDIDETFQNVDVAPLTLSEAYQLFTSKVQQLPIYSKLFLSLLLFLLMSTFSIF